MASPLQVHQRYCDFNCNTTSHVFLMQHSNGERASQPSTTGLSADRLSFFLPVDKHATIFVESLPEYQELVCVSVHKCIPVGWLLVHRLLVDRYPQILLIYPHVYT